MDSEERLKINKRANVNKSHFITIKSVISFFHDIHCKKKIHTGKNLKVKKQNIHSGTR